jgi:hypothetical protein
MLAPIPGLSVVRFFQTDISWVTACGAKRSFMRQVATTKLAVDRQIEHG